MTQGISVTRALAQVKFLNERITRTISGSVFVTHTVGGKSQMSSVNKEELAVLMKSNLQSSIDLIAQRQKLKAAIVRSNAVTQVDVGGVVMSVAEAIERKSSIEFEKQLIVYLEQNLRSSLTQVERINVEVQKRLEVLIQGLVGKDRKVDAAELDAVSKPFLAANEAVLLDPNGIATVIRQKQADIENFLLNVDFALSEINAITLLEV